MPKAKGIGVPFSFDITGYPAPAVDVDLINDSIFTILSTMVGERVYRPTFGSFLRRLIFEPLTRATAYRVRAEIYRAVGLWEPRVRISQVTFEIPNESTILVHVAWVLNGSINSVTTVPLVLDTRA